MQHYTLISGDSHLDLPPDRWTHRVPAKWRDRAPRRVQMENGEDAVVMEGRPIQRLGFTRMNGIPRDQWHKQVPTYDGGVGTGLPEQRLSEQDQDGVDAEVLFTVDSNYLDVWRGIKEDAGYLALIHAYNEYLIEEYASVAPDRLIVMGLIPNTNLGDAMAELEYCANAGFKGVSIYRFPSGAGYPQNEDDRFWSAVLDLNMPIACHSTRYAKQEPTFKFPKFGGKADPLDQILRFASDKPFAALQLAYWGVFDRFPALRVYWAETQVGWLPHTSIQADDNYERYKFFHHDLYGLGYLKRKPSEYIRDNNLWGFLGDPYGVESRHRIGIDSIMWGSDFAHAASDWPNSHKLIDETFVDVPEDERYQLVAGNVIDFFHLDAEGPDAVSKEKQATHT